MGLKLKSDMNDINHLKASLRWIYAVTILVSLIVAGIVWYGFHKSTVMNNLYMPLIDAAMEIKIESANAHLWLEEIVSGNQHEDSDRIWKHLDKADWYAQAMLNGGVNEQGIYSPLKNNEMRGHIEVVKNHLATFRDVAKQRLQRWIIAGPGTDINQYYHTIFDELINHTSNVELNLKQWMRNERNKFWHTQLVLIGFTGLLSVCIGFVYWRFNRQRSIYILSLYHAKANLDKEVFERKVADKLIEEQHEQLQKNIVLG